MAKSSSSSKTWQHHVRSISLPSRLNPHSIKIETELKKLKTWETSLVSELPLSADSLKTGLVGLAELYNCLEELLKAPLTQETLIQYQNENIIEEALEGSIGLLDSCQLVQDSILVLKENVRTLLKKLRRKSDDSSIESDINGHIICSKKLKKECGKSLKTLKQMENKIRSTVHFDANPYLSMVIRVLREIALNTISILRLVFMFISMPILKKKPSRWSFISNVMLKSPSKMNDKIFNDVESVDLSVMKNEITSSMKITRKRFEALDDGLGGLEHGLDVLFRCLIGTRVSLLNILVQ